MKFYTPSIVFLAGLVLCGDYPTISQGDTASPTSMPVIAPANNAVNKAYPMNSDGIQSNVVQGKDNALLGERNRILGQGNMVVGSGNVISGNGNQVSGDSTALQKQIEESIRSSFDKRYSAMPLATSKKTQITETIPQKNQGAIQKTLNLNQYDHGNQGVGQGNLWNGANNLWIGDKNSINGQQNSVVGNDNAVTGKVNAIQGSENLIQGKDNKVIGAGNTISGTGNIVAGANSPDIQAEIMKRFPAWMRDSLTVPDLPKKKKSITPQSSEDSDISKQINAELEARFPAWMRQSSKTNSDEQKSPIKTESPRQSSPVRSTPILTPIIQPAQSQLPSISPMPKLILSSVSALNESPMNLKQVRQIKQNSPSSTAQLSPQTKSVLPIPLIAKPVSQIRPHIQSISNTPVFTSINNGLKNTPQQSPTKSVIQPTFPKPVNIYPVLYIPFSVARNGTFIFNQDYQYNYGHQNPSYSPNSRFGYSSNPVWQNYQTASQNYIPSYWSPFNSQQSNWASRSSPWGSSGSGYSPNRWNSFSTNLRNQIRARIQKSFGEDC